jgi:hypothetical protein
MSEAAQILAEEHFTLGWMLGASAEWRRRGAVKNPEDMRHARAADVADRLRAEVEAYDFDKSLFKRYAAAHRAEQARGVTYNTMTDTVRSIGFGFEPATVDDLLRVVIDKLGRTVN